MVTEPSELAPFGKRITGFIFLLMLSCLMIALAWWGMGYLLTAWSSSSWPHVEGTILSSDVVRVGKSSRVVVKYRYEVDNATYESDRVAAIGDFSNELGGVAALSSRFPQGALVPVYHDPERPESAALITGIPTIMFMHIVTFVLMFFVSLYGTYLSFFELFHKPHSTRPIVFEHKSTVDLVKEIVAGVGMLFVGMTCLAILVMACSSASRHECGGSTAGRWFLGLFLVPLTGLFGWLGIKILINVFTLPVKASDLQNEPEAPRYSESSLICLEDALDISMASAVIVDHESGMIHFRKCFRPTGVVFKTLPCFSAPLSSVASVSQMTFKGNTTLTIQLRAGQACISSTASNFAMLRGCFANVEKTLDPGQQPLDWQTCAMLGGCVVGLVLGFMQPVSPRSSDIFLFLNPIFGVLVCGGASGLIVWALGGFEKKKSPRRSGFRSVDRNELR